MTDDHGRAGATDRLTVEQQQRLADRCADWLAVGLDTTPADRAGAEAGLAVAYRQAGFTPPETVLWVGSPLTGMVLATMLAHGPDWEPPLREEGWYKDLRPSWEHVRDTARAVVRDQAGDGLWHRAGELLGPPVTREGESWLDDDTQDRLDDDRDVELIGDIVADALDDSGFTAVVDDGVLETVSYTMLDWAIRHFDESWSRKVWDQVLAPVGHCSFGQHNGFMLTYATTIAEVRPDLADQLAVDGLVQIARTAGWWWPFTHAAIVTERPNQLHLDDQRRLHHDTGPALTYPDGFAIHAIDVVVVPADIVEHPEQLTPERIERANDLSVREVVRERHDRFNTSRAADQHVPRGSAGPPVDEETAR